MTQLEYESLRFEKYKDIQYALAIDDETFAPILVIKYPNDEFEEYRLSRVEIENHLIKQVNFVESIIESVIPQKLRKIKLDKLNEDNKS